MVQGSINGRVEGALPGILDVPRLVSGLETLASAAAPPPPPDPSEARTPASEAARHKILVDFLHSPGCEDYQTVREQIPPEFMNQFAGLVELREYDIERATNYLRFVRLRERLNVRTDTAVSIIIDERLCLDGLPAIREHLADLTSGLLRVR